MLQLRGGEDLAAEALRRVGGERVVGERLDDYLPAERPLGGDEDPRHAAAAELALDRVRVLQGGAEAVEERIGHGGWEGVAGAARMGARHRDREGSQRPATT